MRKLFIYFTFIIASASYAQVLIDDSSTPNGTSDPSAILELRSESKGLLLPRLAAAPTNSVEGLMYYNTSDNCYKGYNGSSWVDISECLPAGPVTIRQDFDNDTDWGYTVSPATYNENNDVWAIVSSLSTISDLDGNFWGMRDLAGPNTNEQSIIHTLTFDDVDISGESGVVFSFDYESSGINGTSDRYGYQLIYDGVAQDEVDICLGCDQALSGNISIEVPDSVNTFAVIIYGYFDGGSDIAAVDNIQITY